MMIRNTFLVFLFFWSIGSEANWFHRPYMPHNIIQDFTQEGHALTYNEELKLVCVTNLENQQNLFCQHLDSQFDAFTSLKAINNTSFLLIQNNASIYLMQKHYPPKKIYRSAGKNIEIYVSNEDASLIGGCTYTDSFSRKMKPILIHKGKPMNLFPPEIEEGCVYDINKSEKIVGTVKVDNSYYWFKGNLKNKLKFYPLPYNPYRIIPNVEIQINNSDIVMFGIQGHFGHQTFLWKSGKTMVIDNFHAKGMNDSCELVGTSKTINCNLASRAHDQNYCFDALLWKNHQKFHLKDLTYRSQRDKYILNAYSISNLGNMRITSVSIVNSTEFEPHGIMDSYYLYATNDFFQNRGSCDSLFQ